MDENAKKFMEMTGCSENDARRYLRLNNNNLESAVEVYFSKQSATASNSQQSSNPVSTQRVSVANRGGPKIVTLGSSKEQQAEDDNKGTNDYYAGGEHSGQIIRGRGREAGEVDVERLFTTAMEHGAQQHNQSSEQPVAQQRFVGTARTLAGDEVVAKPAEEANEPSPCVITLYNNGYFTVGDGPGRRLDDPANAEFVNDVVKGELPQELQNELGSKEVTVHLIKSRKDYKEPEAPKFVAFRGGAQTLSNAPSSSAAATTQPPPPSSQSVQPPEWPGPDPNQPITSIQLRFPDGQRSVVRINHTQTVGDIRTFIAATRPDLQGITLHQQYPNKQLTDETQSIENAELLQASLIVKSG